MWKTSNFGHFGSKWPILDSFWPKWARRKFFKKALGTFLSRLQALTNWKVSEKSNAWFLRNCLTDGGMDGRDSLGLQRLRRETKKLANSNERIAKKCEKPPFLGIFGQNGQFWTVLTKMGKTGIFSKKRSENFCRADKPKQTEKFQKKVMHGFYRKSCC